MITLDDSGQFGHVISRFAASRSILGLQFGRCFACSDWWNVDRHHISFTLWKPLHCFRSPDSRYSIFHSKLQHDPCYQELGGTFCRIVKRIVRLVSMQVPEPAGAFWGCVVIAGAVVFGALAMAHQSGKIADHMMTTMAQQGDRLTNTCEMMTNTSERLATALAHHSDRLAITGERIASVAETIDVNVNFKQC